MKIEIYLATLFLLIATSVSAQFQDMNWIGGTGDWNDPANWDTGAVPTSANHPQIPTSGGDTVYIRAGVLAEARFLKIEPGAVLVLEESSSLTLTNGRLDNQGTVINRGTIQISFPSFQAINALSNFKSHFENFGHIQIDTCGGKGIQNYWESTFINHEGASIFTQKTGREGVENAGTFTNNGRITCKESHAFGILSNNGFTDFANDTVFVGRFITTGDIYLEGSEGGFAHGIRNSGIFHNLGGNIVIDSTEQDGINNRKFNFDYNAEFLNTGTIQIKSGSAWGGNYAGIQNLFEATFLNDVEGIIKIDSLSITNINTAKKGIINFFSSIFTNNGAIKIILAKDGIENNGIFTNNGTLETKNIGWTHFFNTGANASFVNTGVLVADSSRFAGSRLANSSGGSVENSGEIILRRKGSFFALFNLENSSFLNSGFIKTPLGLDNEGTFVNAEGGRIELDSFRLKNTGASAEFTNNGELFLKTYAAVVQNYEGARFVNSHKLQISDIPFSFLGAIDVQDSSSSFVNTETGSILIQNCGTVPSDFFSSGITLQDQAVFENRNQITLENIAGPGITVSLASLQNHGNIDMVGEIGGYGIRTSGVFINHPGGAITIGGNVRLAGLGAFGTFINESDATIAINSGGVFDFPSTLGGGIFLSNELTNRGQIVIDDNIKGPGLKFRSSAGVVHNEAGGEIFINKAADDGINFDRGNFFNAGKVVFGEEIAGNAIRRERDDELFTNLDSGWVMGVGIIDGNAFANEGTISPGFSPGVFTITDAYNHTGATLEIEIAGTNGPGAAGGHDHLVVDSVASLGGTLTLQLTENFTPATGQSFTLVSCGAVCEGTFDSVNFELDTAIWELDYTSNQVVLSFINASPFITSTPVEIATEDQLYEYLISATDANENDVLGFSVTNLPSWLALTDNGNGTALLRGTPANEDVGFYDIELIVEDNFSGTDGQNFTIEVLNVNDAPLFTSTPLEQVNEEELYSYTVTASDDDEGDVLVISVQNVPDWLIFSDNGEGTALLSGTPENEDVGFYDIQLTVTDDSSATDNQSFTIEVVNVNDSPEFISIPVETAIEDELYQYLIEASDIDEDETLTISTANLPSWLTFTDNGDGTALLQGTPQNGDVGFFDIEIIVHDSENSSETQAFTLQVINTNDPPEFTSDPVLSALEEELYEYNITAFDPDEGDVLAITAQALPDWLELIDNGDGTALLTGTPPLDAEGNYEIELTVADAENTTDQQSFTLTVGNINQTPFFTSTPVETATEDEQYSYEITAEDADGDALEITIANVPEWLTFTDHGNGTALLQGTPQNEDVGFFDIEIIVHDSENSSETQAFTLQVINTNDPPEFTSDPVLSALEEELYEYNITAFDPDEGDVLAITAQALPDWLELIDNGDGTALLTGTPPLDAQGSYEIELTVADAENTTDQQSFTLTVGNINQTPFFTSTPIETATEDEQYSYEITAEDADGDALEITIANVPAWLTFTDHGNGTALLQGTPRNEDVGASPIALTVKDSQNGRDTQSFLITVFNANDAPIFTTQPITFADPGFFYLYEIEAFDPDPEEVLQFSAREIPDWLTLTKTGNKSATLEGFAPTDAGEQYVVSLKVTDLAGEFDLQEFSLQVGITENPIFQTALTPNGDGLNDTWKIESLDGCSGCKVQVFNRWGNKVFSSLGYEREWDGTHEGAELPTGAYYYIIQYENGEDPKTGTVSILR